MALFWELHQNARISSASLEAGEASRSASQAKNELADIRRDLDRLSLACQAMWELLRESTSHTDEEIWAKIEEIDLRDGKQDGKISKQILICPACNRKVSSRHRRCLYCSADMTDQQHVFG